MRPLKWIILLLPFILAAPCFSEYYKWKDEHGVWHFSETPPPERTTFEKRQDHARPEPDETDETKGTEEPPPSRLKPMGVRAFPSSTENKIETPPEHKIEAPSPLERRRQFCLESYPETVIIDTFQLQPKEKKPISIKTIKKTYIGYYTDISSENSRRCGYCIKLKQKNIRASVESPAGGGQDFFPRKGSIHLVIENRASFPVEVEIYKQ